MQERHAVMAINQCSRKMCMLSSYGLAVVCVIVSTVQYFFGQYKAVIRKILWGSLLSLSQCDQLTVFCYNCSIMNALYFHSP